MYPQGVQKCLTLGIHFVPKPRAPQTLEFSAAPLHVCACQALCTVSAKKQKTS